jgi:tmRNA-binding protein
LTSSSFSLSLSLSLSLSDSLSYTIKEKKRGCGYDERKHGREIKSFREEKIKKKFLFFRVSEFFFSDSRFLSVFSMQQNTQKRRRERETKFLMK